MLPRRLDHRLGDRPPLQDLRSAARDGLERTPELRLHELPAERRDLTLGELDARGLGKALELRLRQLQNAPVVDTNGNAFPRQPNGGPQELPPRQPSEAFMHLVKTLHQTRHGDRQTAYT